MQEKKIKIGKAEVLARRVNNKSRWVITSKSLAQALDIPHQTLMSAINSRSLGSKDFTRCEITIKSIPVLIKNVNATATAKKAVTASVKRLMKGEENAKSN